MTTPAFCTACGNPLADGTRFCGKCGASVTATAPPPPPVAAAPAAAPPPPPARPVTATPPPPPTAASTSPTPPPPPQAQTPPAPAAPMPAPQPAAGDRAIAVIPNTTMKTGLIKRTNYTLVLTDRRIIFAEITAAMLKQAVMDARDSAKANGKGFFGQWGAQLGAYGGMAETYLAMAPDQTLAQNPNNFAIDRSMVTACKLKHGVPTDQDNTNSTPDRLIIKTTSGKYSFDLGSGLGQAKKALVAAALI